MFRRTVLSGPVSAFKSLLNLSLRLINPGRNKNNKIISFRGGYVYHLTLTLTWERLANSNLLFQKFNYHVSVLPCAGSTMMTTTEMTHWSLLQDSLPISFLSLGIDRRVKIILGMIVRGLEKMIFAKTSDNQCHMFSVNGHIWNCIVSEEWEKESSSEDFAHVVYVPPHLKSETPQDGFIFTKKDGTVSYGGIKHLRMFKTLG